VVDTEKETEVAIESLEKQLEDYKSTIEDKSVGLFKGEDVLGFLITFLPEFTIGIEMELENVIYGVEDEVDAVKKVKSSKTNARQPERAVTQAFEPLGKLLRK
jgi:SMC interacting uncharacterized protein involved in chromosome segregation